MAVPYQPSSDLRREDSGCTGAEDFSTEGIVCWREAGNGVLCRVGSQSVHIEVHVPENGAEPCRCPPDKDTFTLFISLQATLGP